MNTQTPEKAEDPPERDGHEPDARSIWTGLLAVAGAVATLAGFLYFIGAVSYWIALRNRGYSPDVAIAHQPRTHLITVGIRGGAAVMAIGVLLLAVSLGVAQIARVRAFAERIRFRYSAAGSSVLLLAASFVSWRWLALAIAASTLFVLSAAQLRFPSRWQRRYWFVVLIPATLTAIAWVTGGPIRIPTVVVTPASSTPVLGFYWAEADCTNVSPGYALREGVFKKLTAYGCKQPVECRTRYAILAGKWVPVAEHNSCKKPHALSEFEITRRLKDVCDVPYFGESGSLVYVGGIKRVLGTDRGTCRFDPGELVELRRDSVLLSFRSGRGYLAVSRERPIRTAWDAVANFVRGVDARLLPK